MEQKKIVKKSLIQGIILLAFAFLAMGSATQDLSDFGTGFSQGYSSGSRGNTYIGTASSESDCKRQAQNAGCGTSYEYYPSTGNCFCK